MLGKIYQLGYITPDLEAGLAALAKLYAIGDIHRFNAGEGTPVWTPSGEGRMIANVAVTRVDGLVLEVIQPVGGKIELYTDSLDDKLPLQLHHLGIRSDDVAAARREAEENGWPTVLVGESKGMEFAYVDARASVGHYLEFVKMPARA